MTRYIHSLPDWPAFRWNQKALATQLAGVRHRQGRLLGRMESLGFALREEAVLQTLTLDVLKSSEIEGELLNPEQVRSSVARRLGMDIGGLVPSDRDVDGVVAMMLDATQNYLEPLSRERLFGWHGALFPTGRSGLSRIRVGMWRDDSGGPMRVVSGPHGRERVHYEAVPAARVDAEIERFLQWPETRTGIDPVLGAALAHLWFVTIHPFDDGNGRIARAIADWALARSEGTSQRFYSMSAQIREERNEYYSILETTQRGGMDVTEWMEWFLGCLERAFDKTETTLGNVLRKARFWDHWEATALSERQRQVINLLLGEFEGKLTSSKWAKLGKCSQDTAQRDLQDLVDKGILQRDAAGGRSTSYSLTDL